MTKIGFVGLGHMGLPMALNLIKAGHRVTGYDLQSSTLNQLTEAGGIAATSLADAAKGQEVLITMLQKGSQVRDVCSGAGGLFQEASPETLFIDCSTIDVDSARQVHQLANEHQLYSLDAPVSGGVVGASAGTLTFMVGGMEKTYSKALPILSSMGKKIIHAGGPGAGQAAKICNNMILGISMIAISEAFALAKKLGLSAEKLFEVVTNSSGQCWAISHYVPVAGLLENVPANKGYQPGFTAAMMLKDLLLSQDTANSVAVETTLGKDAAALYQAFVDKGLGELDFSAIIKLITQEV